MIKKEILVLNVTNNCNLNCPYCFGPEKSKKEKDFNELCDIISRAQKEGTKRIVFTGGEPLLRKDIFKLIEYAKKQKLFTILHTNGILLDTDKILKLRKIIDQINLPLDGYDEKTNSEYRGLKHFDKVKKCLAWLKKSGIRVIVSTVATSKNINDIEQIAQVLPKFIFKWRVFQFDPSGKAERVKEEYEVTDERFDKMVKVIKEKDYPFKIQFVKKDDKKFKSSFEIK